MQHTRLSTLNADTTGAYKSGTDFDIQRVSGGKATVFVAFGTRPEAIKMAPVVLELQRRDAFHVVTCVTGQHRETLDQVIETFLLRVDHDLNILRECQSLGHITTAVLGGIDGPLESSRPDLVVVHGDTTTTFAASLAAFYHKIPVAHVEAGLRTSDIYSPYPEEMNRRLADRLASIFYAPTPAARTALLQESVAAESIVVTGNTVIDALLATARWSSRPGTRASRQLSDGQVPKYSSRSTAERTGERPWSGLHWLLDESAPPFPK